MRHLSNRQRRLSALLVATVAAVSPCLLLTGVASAAEYSAGRPVTSVAVFPSTVDAASPLPPIVDDPPTTTEPIPDPEPSDPEPAEPAPPVDPEPDPPATVEPAPSEEPAPEPDPVVPSEEPAPAEDDTPVDESGDAAEEVAPSGVEEAPIAPAIVTPTPTPTATPAPTAPATSAPAPAIDIPFYPPPSAGTARDAFPFAIAGTAAAVVLLLGVLAYVISRRRLRRIRFAPSVAAHPAGSARGLRSPEAISGNLQLPWTTTVASSPTTPGGAYVLGFATRMTAAQTAKDVSYDAAFASPPIESRATASAAGGFFSAFSRRRRGAVSGVEPASYAVFEPLTDRADRGHQQEFGLPFPERRTLPQSGGSFDLGLPAV